MNYKDILVYLDEGDSNTERVSLAISIAKEDNARLTGVALIPEPSLITRVQEDVAGAKKTITTSRKQAKAVLEEFTQRLIDEELPHHCKLIECKEAQAAHELALLARNFDLSIMRQANPDCANASLIKDVNDAVVRSSGRPVLIMPYIGAHSIPCQRAVIAWNGSAASASAVNEALPMLKEMEEVIILVVDTDQQTRTNGEQPGDDISGHLNVHGIENRVVHALSDESSTTDAILNNLSDEGADMLIMGGYGSSKLKEILQGSITRPLLDMMTVPVFMSH